MANDNQLRERDGRAFIRMPKHFDRRQRNCSSGLQFNDDVDEEDGEKKCEETVKYTKSQLTEFLDKQPSVFKRCIAHIDCFSGMHAKPVDQSFSRIQLGSRKQCGRALHGDDVVVEIQKMEGSKFSERMLATINSDPISSSTHKKSTLLLANTECGMASGRVIGILKRMMEPRYRLFVCQVEKGNTSLLVPLNRGMPQLYNLEREEHRSKPGTVSMYRFTTTKGIHFDHYFDLTKVTSPLFVVRYLKWDEHCTLPLGIVVDALPAGETVTDAMGILNIEYNIPREFEEDTLAAMKIVRSITQSRTLPSKYLRCRKDYRDKIVFTIDSTNSKVLDDALSL